MQCNGKTEIGISCYLTCQERLKEAKDNRNKIGKNRNRKGNDRWKIAWKLIGEAA